MTDVFSQAQSFTLQNAPLITQAVIFS